MDNEQYGQDVNRALDTLDVPDNKILHRLQYVINQLLEDEKDTRETVNPAFLSAYAVVRVPDFDEVVNLQEKYSHKVDWKQYRPSVILNVGFCGIKPVVISVASERIEGRLVLLYHVVSNTTDLALIREFWKEICPDAKMCRYRDFDNLIMVLKETVDK